jgi:3-methylfumaryl-CoA hydratase
MSRPSISDWIGRTRTETDVATLAPMRGLASLFDSDPDEVTEGQPLLPSAYWLYFLPFVRHSEIDTDGHPRRGGFLPPVDLPRRMWAGGSLEIGEPARIGETIEKRSTILDIKEKDGRSGRLTFVTVGHKISGPRGVALRERQDIVYREPPRDGAEGSASAKEVVPAFEHSRRVEPDPVLLFRYSALTFNGHRIHYDRDYAIQQEGYRDLVVHGPLIATLLAELARTIAGKRRLSGFTWRGKRPSFCSAPLTLGANCDGPDGLDLLAVGPDGVTMEAKAMIGGAAT